MVYFLACKTEADCSFKQGANREMAGSNGGAMRGAVGRGILNVRS